MAVNDSTSKVTAAGNGTATVFSFSPVVIFASGDLTVTKTDADGVETTLAEGSGETNYSVTVSNYPGTGSITYPATGSTRLETGESLTIKRELDLTQPVELSNQGAYFPKTLERALDRVTMLAIQLQESVGRALKFPISYAGGIAPDLTAPVALRYVRANAAGDGLEFAAVSTTEASASDTAPEDVSLTAAAAGVAGGFAREDHTHKLTVAATIKSFLEAATAAAARTVLGLGTVATQDADDVAITGGTITFGSSELTIASGSITPTGQNHTVDTEGDAASDNLATIVTTNIPDFGFLTLRAANAARTVVIDDAAGNIYTNDSADFSLDDDEKSITLQRRGASFYEVSRSVSSASAHAVFQHALANNTAGGASTSGSWEKRTLNSTQVNSITGASISSSVVTLAAGTYRFEWSAVAYNTTCFQTRLANTTADPDTYVYGVVVHPGRDGGSGQQGGGISTGVAVLTVSEETTFELQQQVAESQATDGYGPPANFGATEVYATLSVEKIS